MTIDEIERKVRNLETLTADTANMTEPQRAAIRDEARELLQSVSPTRSLAKWAAGGAAAGAVLPVLGLFSGAAVGAVVGAVRANRAGFTQARDRLEALLERLR